MIEVRNLTKSYRTTAGRRYVFRNLSFVIPAGRNIALIGRNGAGKSTLMRLLAGQDMPDSGQVISRETISWPVGLTGGFQGSLTGRQNTKFVARLHGAGNEDIKCIVRKVEEFAEIGDYFDQPVNTYSSGMRGRVAFGMSLAFDFDYYLIDEAMSVGDAHFKRKAAAALKERINRAKIILVSHGMTQVRTMCDLVVLLKDGGAEIFEDVEEGIAAYEGK
ncbi:ABC transporter ATP-binding protein [Achromobacter marplatensis]|uniref:ABC transporter ATP-binding protein n=1 Tax=Achromobacter marplatensis TaxID=470868 RepID=UPI0028E3C31B|nr:ABC transporter ATP-binding protein [Achromobacter marplatensis]